MESGRGRWLPKLASVDLIVCSGVNADKAEEKLEAKSFLDQRKNLNNVQ